MVVSMLRSSAGASRPSRRRRRGLSTECRSVQFTYDSGYLVTPHSEPTGTCVTAGPDDPVMSTTVTADSGTAIRLTVRTTTGCGPAAGTAHDQTSPRIGVMRSTVVTTAPRPPQPIPARSPASLRPAAVPIALRRKFECFLPQRSRLPREQAAGCLRAVPPRSKSCGVVA